MHRPLAIAVLAAISGCAPIEVFDDPTKHAPDVPERDDPPSTPVYTPDDTAEVVHDTALPADEDHDGVPDLEDNCRHVANPDQEDMDDDAVGDVCDDERDGDLIPNARDLFPDDPDRPGVASQDHVYPHGPNALYRFDVPSRTLTSVGNFHFNQSGGSVTDVAIDRYGVLYAVTFSNVFICSPQTAQCWKIGSLPGSYNGLTFVPSDDGQIDVLIGIATNGTWTAFPDVPYDLTPQSWGGYGANYTSSGDAFHVRATGTFAAVNGGNPYVDIVETDTHGTVIREVDTLTGHSGVYGIGGWADTIFAFSSNGAILEMKPQTGVWWQVASGPSWWGAGVKTIVVP